jgi:putative endopeptidase
MKIGFPTAIVAAAALSAGCGARPTAGPTGPADPTGPSTTSSEPAAASPVSLENVGLSTAALDRAANPCEDFYQFACGSWLAETEIPADRGIWSRGFNEVDQGNEAELKRILTEAAARAGQPGTDAITSTLGTYYAACMDQAAVEAAGLSGIEPLMAQARAIKKWQQVGPVLIALHQNGIFAGFAPDVDQDFRNPEKVIAHLYQGGLGLPDRDYYLKEDPKFAKLRDAYVGHVARMLVLAGVDATEAPGAAKDVMTLETELAKVSKTRVEMRDIQGIYNRIDRKGLTKTVKNLSWPDYFAAMGVPELNEISVSSVRFFEGLNGLVKRMRPTIWSRYLQWQILAATAEALPKAFVDEAFTMTQALTGQETQRERWKRCIDATDHALPDYLSQLFIKSRFSTEAKRAVETMVAAISDVFATLVQSYEWMDAATAQRALEKRDMMAFLIGYPATWKSYDVAIDRKAYTKNTLTAEAFRLRREWQKTQQPVDRNEFAMSSATVNAYYHPLKNHMVYPAGILQPPFYNVRANVPVNMGGLGMIVGHELTHGFDDQGAKFSGSGALENWWSPAVSSEFKAKNQCVVDQYSAYEILPGVKINGELTLGENIADMGGIKLAFMAYRKLRAGATDPVIASGFTEDQQFFLAVGQAWCSKAREDTARLRAQTDPHSPPRFRVNGSLANLPQFADAFFCPKGTAMHPEKVCSVW